MRTAPIPTPVVLAFAVALPLGCGKEKPPTAPPAADTADGGAPGDGGGADDAGAGDDSGAMSWATMDFDQKKQHMMDQVTPTMAALFQGVSAEHYADFNCVTCHGPGAKEGKFDMPSDALPKLPPNGDFAKLAEAKPDVMKFMAEQVVPQMAGLLDMAPYDPSTNEGFGCYGCHQAEG